MAGTLRSWSAKLAGGRPFAAAVKAAAPDVAAAAVAGMRRAMRQGVSPDGTPYKPLAHARPGGGAKPLMDTGLLAASLSAGVTAGGDVLLRSSSPYAKLMQSGGTIRPKNAHALAIPVTAEARRYKSPRDFPRTLFVLRKKGSSRPGVLAERVSGGAVAVHYVLVKSVTVPARPFLGLTPEAVAAIREKVGLSYANAIAGAAR